MIIGLVRHFKVDIISTPKKLTGIEFDEWMNLYDRSPVIPTKVNLQNINWEICYSSTMPRAEETAKNIYSKEIISSELLVEVPLTAFSKKKIYFPSFVWHIGSRVAWALSSKSQPETIKQTKVRIKKFLDLIKDYDDKNILIVTHGFFMKVFVNELKKIGFNGKIDSAPKNGTLYIFKR